MRRCRGARGPRACRAALPEPTGVVLVDHGSRRAAANSTLHRFARTFRRVSGRELVEVRPRARGGGKGWRGSGGGARGH